MKQLTRILLLCALPTVVACAQAGTPAIKNDNDAAARAATLTHRYQLTSIPTQCLYFDTDDEGADYLVRVREKHSRECGGDPETSPTVFFMRLRKTDGHATTTAYGVDGAFQELKPASKTGHKHSS
jgi:hypothetical protein